MKVCKENLHTNPLTEDNGTLGRIHSFQSLGTVDGPGVRYVVFMQGCPLRCGCCHNPDTWDFNGGKTYTANEVFKQVLRYREYYGEDGGITISGGEPLMQAKFVSTLFALCRENNINTCLDTSGCVINQDVLSLLDLTDRVLLDVKYTTSEDYTSYVGCELKKVLEFLGVLNEKKIKTTIRQVIITTLNDNRENILRLKEIAKSYACVDKVELLPFKKICQAKYDNLKIEFPFSLLPTPTAKEMQTLNEILNG